MKYYKVNQFGDYGKEGFCFTSNRPEGIGAQGYRLAEGMALKSYPEDKHDITLQLDDDHTGLKKGSLLGNVSSLLIMDNPAKDIILSLVDQDIETFPFMLLDHKGRVHSEDYFFINPLKKLKCINLDASDIEFEEDGEISVIWKLIFDKKALNDAPHLFRIDPVVRAYYISEVLKGAFETIGVTNFMVKEVPAQ